MELEKRNGTCERKELISELQDYTAKKEKGERSRTVSLSLRQAKFLSEVQVEVEVEIGQLQMSAEELIDLLPGHCFEFSFDPLSPITLRVGGERVACAKFVLKNDQLALEILQVEGQGIK